MEIHSQIFSLRKATEDDAKLLFEWRNDPETRAQSRTPDRVLFEYHTEWLLKSLKSDSRKLYIAENNGIPVGTVRADRDERGAELSWTVSPSMRAQGFGKIMVLVFVDEILERGEKIFASVREGNFGSEKIAQSLGLKPSGQEYPDETGDHRLILWK